VQDNQPNGLELTGYADRLIGAPGDCVRFMVSTSEPRYDAAIVRLIHGDRNPAGPGPKEERIAACDANGQYAGRRQISQAGSYLAVGDAAPLGLSTFTMQAWILPTAAASERRQALLSRWCSIEQRGYGVFLEAGRLTVRVDDGHRAVILRSNHEIRDREWSFVAATFDVVTARAVLYQRTLSPWSPHEMITEQIQPGVDSSSSLVSVNSAIPFRIGAAGSCEHEARRIADAYDGKIDRPRLFGRALFGEEIADLAAGRESLDHPDLIAAWDFSDDQSSVTIRDCGPHSLHATAVNMPTRAVTGARWTGSETDFRLAPPEYSAIHFHSDDLEDAGWESDFSWTIPADARSGIYAARLQADDNFDHIPFVVGPQVDGPNAAIAVLVPTMTYVAYANERMGDPMQPCCPPDWPSFPEPLDDYLAEHPELGKSLYDLHDDGSGVCYSSALRPIPNLRPGYRARAFDAPRHLGADLYLIDWLEAKGFRYEVISDGHLQAEGQGLLDRFDILLTGSHPEYCSGRMIQAIEAWVHDGGRMMYLGGNGFYWVTSVHRDRPHVIEVRRGVSGSRPWESEPGEAHHSTTGEIGGLWRHRGKLPNRLLGVGFAAQGADGLSVGYRRDADISATVVSEIFEGVDAAVIGDFGLVMGGAAGDEVDRADMRLGTPIEAIVLASSEPLSEFYGIAEEDSVAWRSARTRGAARADMVLLEAKNGGAVFSVGSISWCGSLSQDNYDNNVSRVTENVLRRFAGGPAPPGGSGRVPGAEVALEGTHDCYELAEAVAVVTGAGGGLGRAMIRELASAGATVVVLERDREAGLSAVAELEAAGAQARLIETDVADSQQVDAAFREVSERYARLDILVNNAGIDRTGPHTHEVSDEDWLDAIGVMQSGVFYCMRAAGRLMIPRRSGSVVNISSIRGFSPNPGRMTYSPAKAAVIMMTKIAAGEWGPHGIRVNAIAPGFTRTPMHDAGVARGMIDEEQYLRVIPVGRFGTPEEIGKLVVFLCSSAASYITGACITIDGGLTTIPSG
jgi:N,N-dimethylformamidase